MLSAFHCPSGRSCAEVWMHHRPEATTGGCWPTNSTWTGDKDTDGFSYHYFFQSYSWFQFDGITNVGQNSPVEGQLWCPVALMEMLSPHQRELCMLDVTSLPVHSICLSDSRNRRLLVVSTAVATFHFSPCGFWIKASNRLRPPVPTCV